MSATDRIQLDTLVDELITLMPVSEALYPDDAVTDEGLEARVAELVREAALEGVSEELPHSLAVTIDDMVEREDKDLVEIYVNLFVERDSQKGIIIGKGGARLQDVGARARAAIEPLVGKQVFLSIRVKVAKDWQRDPKLLGRLGFYRAHGRASRHATLLCRCRVLPRPRSAAAASGGRVPAGSSSARLGGLDFPVLRRSGRHQIVEQMARDVRDLFDSQLECRHVRS